MLVFVGCNYERLPFVGYRDAFRDVQSLDPRILFRFADVRISNQVIMEKVRNEILNCDVGLYDVTFRNPNVMMELGIAIGASKKWNILYNPDKDRSTLKRNWFDRTNVDLPANLRGYEYLQYGSPAQLRMVLADWAKQALEQESTKVAQRWANTAGALTELLAAHPGLGINEIASKTGEHTAMIRIPLSELRKRGILRTTGKGPATRYYVSARALRRVQRGQEAQPPTRPV